MSNPPTGTCKDCPPGARVRPSPHPGPRCATHWRAEVKRRKLAAHDTRVQKVYGLQSGQYGAIYNFQGGTCAICLRAKGTGRRKLAVDHDHTTGAVRGLLCSTCNQMLGHARDEPDFFARTLAYLREPPAIRMEES